MSVRRHYYDHPAYVVTGASILGTIAILVTALRVQVRIKQKQPFKADDWLVLPAVVCAPLLCTLGRIFATNIDLFRQVDGCGNRSCHDIRHLARCTGRDPNGTGSEPRPLGSSHTSTYFERPGMCPSPMGITTTKRAASPPRGA